MKQFPTIPIFFALFAGIACSYAVIAASTNGFVLDGALIPEEEIFFGGPPKDGIPSLDHPQFVKAERASFLQDKDRMLALKRNGIAKAYPFVELAKGSGEVNDRLAG